MGDETWVHHFEPESKQQSMKWKHTSSPPTKKLKNVPSAKKSYADLVLGYQWAYFGTLYGTWTDC
jgi:hypothetical protein